jgi:hypothetical protein
MSANIIIGHKITYLMKQVAAEACFHGHRKNIRATSTATETGWTVNYDEYFQFTLN